MGEKEGGDELGGVEWGTMVGLYCMIGESIFNKNYFIRGKNNVNLKKEN